jgi:hypothetical protein
MELKIIKEIATKIPVHRLRALEIEMKSFDWHEAVVLDLADLTKKQISDFEEDVRKFAINVRGVKVLLRDIETWKQAVNKPGKLKARTVQHFFAITREYIAHVPGHRLYKKNDVHGEAWLCYYVDQMEFLPEQTGRDGRIPPKTKIDLVWEEFGGRKEKTLYFESEDCRGFTVEEALARLGFYGETAEMRASYIEEAKRFASIIPHIGKQYMAVGIGTDDLDGNNPSQRETWWYSRTNKIHLDKDGQPSRVVIDIFVESDKERDRDSKVNLNLWFWTNFKSARELGREVDEDSEEGRHEVTPEDLDVERPEVEIPIHPFCAVFDMKRHLRLMVHVNYLTEYVYDRKCIDKLILPPEVKNLVRMLIEYKGTAFKDIVANKSGGAIILACGPPGTGKTLTAEVFAEAEERPLYSVQASQLGIEPEELEDELMKVLARARRWNAVMLLDEADVYVHKRGNDIAQNAIVGVFLRVLEYHSSILFMTTNRSQDVDDAIASRCMARLTYGYPSAPDQESIWTVLSAGSGINISIHTIREIVAANKKLSGRDVKNLLKLAQLVSSVEGKPITAKSVQYVKQFKPTNEDE